MRLSYGLDATIKSFSKDVQIRLLESFEKTLFQEARPIPNGHNAEISFAYPRKMMLPALSILYVAFTLFYHSRSRKIQRTIEPTPI